MNAKQVWRVIWVGLVGACGFWAIIAVLAVALGLLTVKGAAQPKQGTPTVLVCLEGWEQVDAHVFRCAGQVQ
jgi:hypothetical protein